MGARRRGRGAWKLQSSRRELGMNLSTISVYSTSVSFWVCLILALLPPFQPRLAPPRGASSRALRCSASSSSPASPLRFSCSVSSTDSCFCSPATLQVQPHHPALVRSLAGMRSPLLLLAVLLALLCTPSLAQIHLPLHRRQLSTALSPEHRLQQLVKAHMSTRAKYGIGSEEEVQRKGGKDKRQERSVNLRLAGNQG